MPESYALSVLLLLLVAMALFIWGRLRADVVALCLLAVVGLLGLALGDKDANAVVADTLSGFSSPATATVAAMFVISAALVRTGLVQWLVRHLDRLAGKTERRLILLLCVTVAGLSAFIVNTGTIAIFIPVAIFLARSRKISPSRVLMPLSFASQFGGVCTLIGTSTNILVNAIAIGYGLGSFGLFEFAPLGLIMCAVGIVYLMFAGPAILPKRKGEQEQVDQYRLNDYLIEMRVQEKSPLIDELWSNTEGGREKDVNLIKIIRDDKATWRASRTKIRQDDILLLHGHAETLIRFQGKYKLKLLRDVRITDKEMSSDEVKLIEALVPPRSHMIGNTLSSFSFTRRFGCIPLAIQRRRQVLRDRLTDIRFEEGDTLLLQGDQSEVGRVMKSSDLVVTNELTELLFRKDRAIRALLLLLLVVVLAALNVVPIVIAVVIGALGTVLTKCLTIEEAYDAIDWRVIFLLGGILPLGLAIEQSGAAQWLADTAVTPFLGAGPLVVLAILYLLTAVLTENMSNTAAAAILAPIAVTLAGAMEVDPRPFLIAITFAASTSFATPVGYQTNTMIYAVGGYRFTD